MDIPKYIEGIPTGRNEKAERRKLIAKYYDNLWKNLQKQGLSNHIYNQYLGVNIFIIKGESDKKPLILPGTIGNQHTQSNIFKLS